MIYSVKIILILITIKIIMYPLVLFMVITMVEAIIIVIIRDLSYFRKVFILPTWLLFHPLHLLHFLLSRIILWGH